MRPYMYHVYKGGLRLMTPFTINIPNAQLLASKYHSPPKGSKML